MNRLPIAVIGCGRHARTNLLPLLPSLPFHVAAVADIDPNTVRETAAAWRVQGVYEDYRELLQREKLVGVIVATGGEHAPIVRDCLERHLHVFVEKPPSRTAAGARELAALSRTVKRQVMVGFMKRFAPGYVLMQRLARSSDFGAVALTSRYLSGPYQSGKEFLLDFGIHHLDLARYVLGEVEAIDVVTLPGPHHGYAVTLRMQGHRVAHLLMGDNGSWQDPGERVDLFGAGARLTVENLWQVMYYSGAKGELIDKEFSLLRSSPHVVAPNLSMPNQAHATSYWQGYLRELSAFAQTCMTGILTTASISDGVAALELCEEIERQGSLALPPVATKQEEEK
jgi:predicted dehydrogenase